MSARARIQLSHGSGGRSTRSLIEEVFLPGLRDEDAPGIGLDALDDGAALPLGERWLVVTTDSHVIHPVCFPGGDIGRLAVAGTVNDLAMMGATDAPLLALGVVLEEGFSRDTLERVQASLAATCREAGARVVTGDTKVMGRGELDGIVLHTTGIGLADRVVRDSGLAPGDRILVTGSVGDHGLAVLAARAELELEGELRSDVAPLNDLVRLALAAGGDDVVALKDPTRGGVASALVEMATKSGVGVVLDEASVPVKAGVRAAGELLGIDPLHVANEGKALLGVRAAAVDAVLDALRGHPLGRDAASVGICTAERPGSVILETGFGRRLLQELEGEPLPRIC